MSTFNFGFKDVIEQAGDIVVITKAFPLSESGPEIAYVNKAFTDLTGYSCEEAIGCSPRMLQRGDTDPKTKKIIRAALEKQQAVRVTIRNYSKQGVGYWLEMSILPLRDEQGTVTHFAAIERDITESKERELLQEFKIPMLTIFGIIFPIFLLIGIGYLAVIANIIKPEALPSIGAMVLYITVPATLFNAISRINFSEAIEPTFIVAYALTALITFGAGLAISHWIFKQDIIGGTVQAMGMSLPNSIFIAFPILLLTFPEVATIAFVMAVLVENLIILPFALIFLAYGAEKKPDNPPQNPWRAIGLRIIKNPIILSIVAGVLASLINLDLPAPLTQTLQMLAHASATVALIVIGGTLASNSLRGNLNGVGLVMFGKLLLMPLVAAILIWLLPDFDPNLQKAVIIIASTPMLTIYPILCESAGYRSFCSNALIITTIAAFLSITVVLSLVGV